MVVASSCFILNLFQLVQREFLMICFAKRYAMHITRNTYVNCKPQRTKYTFDAERAGKTFVNFGALGTNSLPNNPSIITDPILLCVILCVGKGGVQWDCCCSKATLLCTFQIPTSKYLVIKSPRPCFHSARSSFQQHVNNCREFVL